MSMNKKYSLLFICCMVLLLCIGCSIDDPKKPDSESTEKETQSVNSEVGNTEIIDNTEIVDNAENTEIIDSTEIPAPPKTTNGVSLTTELIDWFNKYFFNRPEEKIVNYFLLKEFSDIKEIDLLHLFYDMPEGSEGDMCTEELKKVRDAQLEYERDFDVHKVPVSYMEQVLQKYGNISFEQTTRNGLKGCVYLQEYDAYYILHNDYGYKEVEILSGYTDEAGLVHLRYNRELRGEYEVILQPHEDSYRFVSNLKIE